MSIRRPSTTGSLPEEVELETVTPQLSHSKLDCLAAPIAGVAMEDRHAPLRRSTNLDLSPTTNPALESPPNVGTGEVRYRLAGSAVGSRAVAERKRRASALLRSREGPKSQELHS